MLQTDCLLHSHQCACLARDHFDLRGKLRGLGFTRWCPGLTARPASRLGHDARAVRTRMWFASHVHQSALPAHTMSLGTQDRHIQDLSGLF